MKTYTVNDRLELVGPDGEVLGRVVFELNVNGEAPSPRAPFRGQTSTATSKATARSKSKSKDSAENSIAVQAAWAYWIEKRKPLRTKLEPSMAQKIAKGLELVGEDGLRAAMEGLLASEWHREHKRLHLSTILATKPGGPTLGDLLDSFIEKSPAIEQETKQIAELRGRLRNAEAKLAAYERRPESELREFDPDNMAELRTEIAELRARIAEMVG